MRTFQQGRNRSSIFRKGRNARLSCHEDIAAGNLSDRRSPDLLLYSLRIAARTLSADTRQQGYESLVPIPDDHVRLAKL